MTEEEWLKSDDADEMTGWVHWGPRSDRKRFLLIAGWMESLRPYLADQRLLDAREALEYSAEAEAGEIDWQRLLRAMDEVARARSELWDDACEQRWWHAQRVATDVTLAALHPESYEHLSRVPVETLQALELFAGQPNEDLRSVEKKRQAAIVLDIFGNPFRPVTFDPAWRTEAAVGIAHAAYDSREFGNLPVLADALQDAGCEHPDILTHLRGPGPHVRGCWVIDLVLGKT